MLYDAIDSSEDGILILETEEKIAGHVVTMQEWQQIPGGILLSQGKDLVALDARQVEELYIQLKHNR